MTELAELLQQEYGGREYGLISAGYAVERPASFRVNTGKTTVPEVLRLLGEKGIAAEAVGWYDAAFVTREEEAIRALPLYRDGMVYFQSLSSMLPPLYLAPAAGESILDMTAAPGGKTTELYALSGGKALITACERDKIRFGRLKFNLERQGATRVTALNCDASRLDEFLSFDKILLDAPCTGSGTVTPHTSVRFSRDYLNRCMRLQEALLGKALRLLKRGGTMVYSTCSVLREENGELLGRILPKAGAEIVPIAPFGGIPTLVGPEGTVTVCPSELYEGFFVAKIIKK